MMSIVSNKLKLRSRFCQHACPTHLIAIESFYMSIESGETHAFTLINNHILVGKGEFSLQYFVATCVCVYVCEAAFCCCYCYCYLCVLFLSRSLSFCLAFCSLSDLLLCAISLHLFCLLFHHHYLGGKDAVLHTKYRTVDSMPIAVAIDPSIVRILTHTHRKDMDAKLFEHFYMELVLVCNALRTPSDISESFIFAGFTINCDV